MNAGMCKQEAKKKKKKNTENADLREIMQVPEISS